MAHKIEQDHKLIEELESKDIPPFEDGDEGESNVLLLGQALKSMGVTSKVNSAEELQDLMVSYLQSVGKLSSKEPEGVPGNVPSGIPTDSVSWNKGVNFQSHQGPSQFPAMPGPIPRLSLFFGESGKGEASYDLWVYEVNCLLAEKTYPKNIIFEAVRRSLKGKAGKVASLLGSRASLETVLNKLQSVYGTCEESESLMASFYSAKQLPDEDVTTWGCRLEDLYAKATQNSNPSIDEINQALKSVFWQGLKPALKDISGHKYDSIQDFDKFRVAIRRLEHELSQRNPPDGSKKPHPAKMAYQKPSEMQELKDMVKELSAELTNIKKQMTKPHSSPPVRGNIGGGNSRKGRYNPNVDKDLNVRGKTTYDTPYLPYKGQTSPEGSSLPVCWKCGQLGHIWRGCRINMDHHQPLNGQGPMDMGNSWVSSPLSQVTNISQKD
ncbi:uncharacterized protein [Haliotis asinina]|uniref:uncharacterized protein n=1 Tax=Haliotis asinina TaxID=109174 RepID=UPI003531BB57